MADRRRDGNDPIGERNGRAKLTRDEVQAIRDAAAAGTPQAALARRYGVHPSTIRDIVRGRIWRAAA